MIWFGRVLWHINHCWLFNAKSFLDIYIKHIISKHIVLITFLNGLEFISFALSSMVSLIFIYQLLPLRVRMNLEVMVMKEYSAFPKAPALLEPHHQIV